MSNDPVRLDIYHTHTFASELQNQVGKSLVAFSVTYKADHPPGLILLLE